LKTIIEVFFAFVVFALPSLAIAEEAVGEAEGIPTSLWLQVANFLIYLALMVYFLRKPIKSYFVTRQEAFRQALIHAKTAKHEAEKRKTEIQERLSALESSAAQSLKTAKSEADAIRARILNEASELSENLRKESARAAQFEIERAKRELREELLGQSMLLATKVLTEKMADPDQKRLQTEFVEKIQVVS
jgi:F-type H+-transporting ATPase subunit b